MTPSARALPVALLLVSFFAFGERPVSGQGVGTPASTGLVPRIDFEHQEVGIPVEVRFRGFAPGSPLVVFVAHGQNPVPLGSEGYGPAVLGPDLQSPLGAVAFESLGADALGEYAVTLVAPPVVAGLVGDVQAAAIDPGAPFGGVAFSEHRRVIFGFAREKQAFAFENPDGTHFLAEVFEHGAFAAPTDPRLAAVTFVEPLLVNSNEMAAGGLDRPAPDPFRQTGPALRIPGGELLYLVRTPGFADGLVAVRPDGRISVLAWAQGGALDPAFGPEIALSAHAPLAAVAAEGPLPEYGGAQLLLVRTDGWNVAGSHLAAKAVPVPAGVAVDGSTLAFLDGALFFGDGESQLWRYDLDDGTTSPVAFPPSGAAAPVYLDESCATAADGSALVLGAGFSEDLHDVYLVTAAGSATNLTQNPADYEDAGPGRADGMQLAISDDGAWVAYMRTVVENESFILPTAPGATEIHVTEPGQFIDSIDTVIGTGFRAGGRLVFIAGQDENATDLYRADPLSAVAAVSNLSASSGATTPVYGLGATLQLERRFNAAGLQISELSDTAGGGAVLALGPEGAATQVASGAIVATAARDAGLTLVTETGSGTVEVRAVVEGATPASAPVIAGSWSSGGVALRRALATDPDAGRLALFLEDAGQPTLVISDPSVGVATLPTPGWWPPRAAAIGADGALIALVADPTGTSQRVERLAPGAGAWSVVSAPITGPLSGSFLR